MHCDFFFKTYHSAKIKGVIQFRWACTPSANNFLHKNNKVSACILVTIVTKLLRCKWQLAFRHPLNSMIKKSQCELFFFQFSNQHFHSVAFCQQRQTCQAIYVESLRKLCTYNQFTLTHSLTTTLVRWREGAHIKAHCNLPCIEEVTDLVIRETSKVRQTGYISFYLPIFSRNLQCCTDFLARVCCFHCPLLHYVLHVFWFCAHFKVAIPNGVMLVWIHLTKS